MIGRVDCCYLLFGNKTKSSNSFEVGIIGKQGLVFLEHRSFVALLLNSDSVVKLQSVFADFLLGLTLLNCYLVLLYKLVDVSNV